MGRLSKPLSRLALPGHRTSARVSPAGVPVARMLGAVLLVSLLLSGCSQDVPRGTSSPNAPVVRVLILQGKQQVELRATQAPTVIAGQSTAQRVQINGATTLRRQGAGWVIGQQGFGDGELVIRPAATGSLSVDGASYRGELRAVPRAGGGFDIVNHVDIDSYLKSVVSKELLWDWSPQTYRAQAIVARTYAMFEWKTQNPNLHYDLFADTRNQVYGGIEAESRKSREAVDATSGVVVAHGPPGRQRIFKAYFASCCGGVTQSASDAFGDAWSEPLSELDNHDLCKAAPRFRWEPVVVRKEELTRRFRHFGAVRGRPEKDMAMVHKIEVQAVNRFKRPVRFVVTDVRGNRFSWTGEEIRWAVNSDARGQGQTLYSSFFKIINDTDVIRFVDGRGWGHGVGMCQWCAEQRARDGMRHEDIIAAAYPRTVLKRAY